jgi:hypothetical protein
MLRFTAWLLALVFNSAFAHGQSLPADVSTRVGRAGEFVYAYTPYQYAHNLNARDVVWDNRPTSFQGGANLLHFPAGTLFGGYTAVNRVPAEASVYGPTRVLTTCGIQTGGCPLSWFRANHPTWIIYKADQVTPAYQFSDTAWIPLDISNTDVQSFVQKSVYTPMLTTGYQAISVDNVAGRNDFGEVGTCSIAPTTNCTADGGAWTALYSGAVHGDAAFIANRVAWARAITAWAHAHSLSTIGNVTYDPANKTATASLVNAFDIWYDEPGFTGDETPSSCTPNNASGVVGVNWINKVAFITSLNSGAGPNAYITENSICPLGAVHPLGVNRTFEVVEFAVASYLIVKNTHTYLSMYFSDGNPGGGTASFNDHTPTAAWPQFYLTHGVARGPYSVIGNVYHRAFANAVALVNPSTELSRTYDLGSKVYHRSDCRRYTGTVTLPPITGMVLLNGEPVGCIP